MKLYFAWVQEDDIFDASQHAHQKVNIFSFCLTEREGAFPLVTLEIENSSQVLNNTSSKQWCFISLKAQGEIKLLFKGKQDPVPHSLNRETVRLNFIAQPSDWMQKLQILHEGLKHTDSWDPLFVGEEDQDNPQESLEARSELFYWSRTGGRVSLSNIFWGSHQVNLKDNHFYDSLNFRLGAPPLQEVRISLSVQWVQKYLGQTNLTPFITSCFQEGIVNTLTGKDLEAKWWKNSEKIGQSGYWILESSIQEIKPAYTGVLHLYAAHSLPFWISPQDSAYGEQKPDQPQQKFLKRSWYKVHLKVGWIYRQKRQEKIEFVLRQDLQKPFNQGGNQRHLKLHLENIVQDHEIPLWHPSWNYSPGFQVLFQNRFYKNLQRHRSGENFQEDQHYWQEVYQSSCQRQRFQGRFFTSERGRKAVEHALERARAHLAASARAIEITIAGPLEHFMNLTCDHTIRIQDHRLPGESVWGKVKSLKLCIEGKSGKQWGEAILGVSIGTGAKSNDEECEPQNDYVLDYVEHDYGNEDLKGKTISGIQYTFSSFASDQDKWLYPESLTSRDIVEEVVVKNSASTQNAYLHQHQYPLSHYIEGNLKKVPTDIHIRLADLRPKETGIKTFTVNCSSWAAPHQIKLTHI